jgi:methylated-DNA-protein-cysteine methyltransferase related protein
MARSAFTVRVIEVIGAIPPGKVSTYGTIAELAGNPQAARQVVRVLHSCSETENLPWHRVVNRLGRIALGPFDGYDRQKELLEAEGVEFDKNDRIDLERFCWQDDLDPLC